MFFFLSLLLPPLPQFLIHPTNDLALITHCHSGLYLQTCRLLCFKEASVLFKSGQLPSRSHLSTPPIASTCIPAGTGSSLPLTLVPSLLEELLGIHQTTLVPLAIATCPHWSPTELLSLVQDSLSEAQGPSRFLFSSRSLSGGKEDTCPVGAPGKVICGRNGSQSKTRVCKKCYFLYSFALS